MSALELSRQELSDLINETMDLAHSYLSSVGERRAYPLTSSEDTTNLFTRAWPERGIGRSVLSEFKTIADHVRPSGGKMFAYVVGSGEVVGAVGDMLATALNQNVTSWRSSPAGTSIERTVVSWLAEAVGCVGHVGSLCGGGSAANLMGLAMAREAKLPANETGARPCVVYASEEVHMAIPKAIALLGIGRSNLRMIPVDDDFRMRTDALEAAIEADRQAGRVPIAIVATAGTVNIGAVDPLPALADIAKRQGLWLHVDGAYGGLAAIADPEKFRGLEQADSLAIDAHKWLYQPIDCGCLLYRDRSTAQKTFSHSGDYIRVFNEDPVERFAFFEESMELTRRFRALKLWFSLQYHGLSAFREAIAEDLRHAQLLAREIRSEPSLELLAPVPLSAVCFRHRTKDNEGILRRVNARGRVHISNATIKGRFALRACFVNHQATDEDALAILSEIMRAAEELNA